MFAAILTVGHCGWHEQPRRNPRVRLSLLLVIAAAFCFTPVTGGRCPVENKYCDCFDDDLRCESLGNISQVPSFLSYNHTFDRLRIERGYFHRNPTNLRVVQARAFAGLRVKAITMNGIGITKVEAGAFSGLEGILEYVDLSNNPGIGSLPDNVFSGLGQSLKELQLVGCGLLTVSFTLFSKLSHLEVLQLAYNRFVTVPEDTFNDLKSLKGLYLYSNRLTTLLPAVFTHLTKLQTLYIDHNRIDSIPNNVFNKLNQSLTRLNLEHNVLTSISSTLFLHLSRVDWLHLGSNRLVSIHDDAFNGLSNSLRILNLQINRLTYVKSVIFQKLTNLIQLVLEKNQIMSIADDAFNGFKQSMKWLHLNNNNLTTVSPDLFINLERLETVYLGKNPFTCDCRMAWVRSSKLSNKHILRDTPVCFSPSEVKGSPVTSYVVLPCEYYTRVTTKLQITSNTGKLCFLFEMCM